MDVPPRISNNQAARQGGGSIPITALLSIPSSNLILVCHGGHVSLYLTGSGECSRTTCSVDVLGDKPIHGITCLAEDVDESFFLVWGWNLVCSIRLCYDKELSKWKIDPASAIFDAVDWVFSMCCMTTPHHDRADHRLALLNAHNEVRILSCHISNHVVQFSLLPGDNVQRKPIMLYSGHVRMIDGRLVTAAGTMFGQVLFEVYGMIAGYELPFGGLETVISSIQYDHEGSVFGVSILERMVLVREQAHYRIASCSDDRTLRVYEIPNISSASEMTQQAVDTRTGFRDFLNVSTNSMRETSGWAMGHESRIWTVLWLEASETSSRLITFGEDATSQLWQVNHTGIPSAYASAGVPMKIEPRERFSFHIGKNIWAACVSPAPDGSLRVCTGGADGRLAYYRIESVIANDVHSDLSPVTTHVAQKQLTLLTDDNSELYFPANTSQAWGIFFGLQGRWKIQRKIISQRPEYPSGNFNGEAVLTQRSVTDDGYTAEMLYEEQGTLVLASGMSFPARKNYVYRLRSEEITAWFVKPDAPREVDYVFHQVQFKNTQQEQRSEFDRIKCAAGYHLCVADHYDATYEFLANEAGIKRWNLAYKVRGPQKDYVATSSFTSAQDASAMQSITLSRSSKTHSRQLAKPDTFRSYTWLLDGECVITTDQGRVLTLTIDQTRASLKLRMTLPSLVHHSLACALDKCTILIAAGNGQLYLCTDTPDRLQQNCIGTFESKITSLLGLEGHKSALMKCIGASCLKLVRILREDQPPEIVDLEASKPFLPTSACLLRKGRTLLVGSRATGLSIWQLLATGGPRMTDAPTVRNKLIHGADAITSIKEFPRPDGNEDADVMFLTTGRDGMVMVHRLIDAGKDIQTLHALRWTYGSKLEGAALTSELILWGFDGTDFIVADYTRNMEISRVACGDSHRNWAFNIAREDPKRIASSLIWTQAGDCHVRVQKESSHGLVANGSHGREIKALATTAFRSQVLVATGAEDTDIKLFSLTKSKYSSPVKASTTLQNRATLSRHETGPTHLEFKGDYLFSAGGKEELFMWKIHPLPEPFGLGICFQAKCPQVEEGLLRITDFCFMPERADADKERTGGIIAVVYSDSSLRIWRYTVDPPAFSLIALSRYSEHCLTCVAVLHCDSPKNETVLITASTDGHLILWNTSTPLTSRVDDGPNVSSNCSIITTYHAHVSAIKAMLIQALTPEKTVVVTGGDDGSIAITIILLRGSGCEFTKGKQVRIPRAHAASVNAVVLVECKASDREGRSQQFVFASTGSDQKVATWILHVEQMTAEASMPVLRIQRSYASTAVADASGLASIEKGLLVVAGVGTEIVECLTSELEDE